jgi:glutamate-1-semialdehyde 2,1-aminomutase
MDGLKKIANEEGVSLSVDSVGGMFGLYFSDKVPQSFAEVKEGNQELFNRFFHLMLDRGVFFAPSMYEAGFISAVHDNKVIDKTLAIARDVFKIL